MTFRACFSLFVALFVCQSLYSQQDSLVDVFPLAVGNQWTYRYNKVIGDAIAECQWTDSGVVSLEVRARNVRSDSTVWTFDQRRVVEHSWWCFGGGTGRSDVVDTSRFELIERHEGQHQMYRLGGASSIAGEIFPFTREYVDSTMILKFRSVDSSGGTRFRSGTVFTPGGPSFSGIFEFENMVGLRYLQFTAGYLQTVVHGDHRLLNSVIVEVDDLTPSGLYPTTPLLLQNYPNPFNPTTTIEYTLPHHASVSLKLVDVLGREVMTLLDARQEAGIHRVMFNADNLSSGVYFYRLKAGDYIATRKLLYLR